MPRPAEYAVRLPTRSMGVVAIVHAAPGGNGAGVLMVHSQGSSKTGHKRAFVELARFLATRGIASVRLDLAGEGDSEESSGAPTQHWRGLAPALSYMIEELGLTRVALLGDCHGALLAANYAHAEARVGLVLAWNLDHMQWTDEYLQGYSGWRGETRISLRIYAQKALRVDTWRRLLLGELDLRYALRTTLVRMVAASSRRWFARRSRGTPAIPTARAKRRRVPMTVIHAASSPAYEQTLSITQHVFERLKMNAKHVSVAGPPFYEDWKRDAFALIERLMQADDWTTGPLTNGRSDA